VVWHESEGEQPVGKANGPSIGLSLVFLQRNQGSRMEIPTKEPVNFQ
jgi:hypothetical protein